MLDELKKLAGDIQTTVKVDVVTGAKIQAFISNVFMYIEELEGKGEKKKNEPNNS